MNLPQAQDFLVPSEETEKTDNDFENINAATKIMEIVRKDEDDNIVERYDLNDADDGFLGARKKFGELRFTVELQAGERLELVVNGKVNLCHPLATKKKKKTSKQKKDDDEEKPPPAKKSKSDDKENALKTLMQPKEEKKPPKEEKPVYSESEEEWDPEPVKKKPKKKTKSDEVQEEVLQEEKTGLSFKQWCAFGEKMMKPAEEDARGDEWNDVDDETPSCETVLVVKSLRPKALAERFHEQGLLVLDGAKYAVPEATVTAMRETCTKFYETKLAEAQADGLTSKKKPHCLAKGNEEAVAGFNQRPGGRVDMVLDEVLDAGAFPFEPVVHAILGKDASRNYIGCVVARPGDKMQNWHIDGVHPDKSQHRPADRVICFVPLTDLTEATGTTEMIPGSHFHSRDDSRTSGFNKVAHLPRARHYLAPGTPLIMDYRLWHRGLANTSDNQIRYLLYAVFQRAKDKHALEDVAGPLNKFI